MAKSPTTTAISSPRASRRPSGAGDETVHDLRGEPGYDQPE